MFRSGPDLDLSSIFGRKRVICRMRAEMYKVLELTEEIEAVINNMYKGIVRVPQCPVASGPMFYAGAVLGLHSESTPLVK